MTAYVKRMNGIAIALLLLGFSVLAFAGTASAASFSFSKTGNDPSAYIPGEQVTITYSGLNPSNQYDVRIGLSNGTQLLDQWNITPDGAGNFVWILTIPNDWDGYYYVRGYNNGSASTMNVASFQVYLFRLTAQLDHSVYLPGDTMTVYYFTQQLSDQKPLSSGHGFWKATIRRDNGSGPDIIDPVGNSISSPSGSFTFQLPAGTKTGSYNVDVTFNDTTDQHSDAASLTLYVGALQIDVTLDRSVYAPGDPVVVRVDNTADYSFISEPSANVVLTTKVYEYDEGNATWVEDSSYTVPSQTSGVSGTVSFVITLEANIPDDEQYRVTVSAAKGGATPEASATFTVRSTISLFVDLTLDKTTYKPGDTLRGHVAIISSNATLVSGAMYQWQVESSSTNAVLASTYGTSPDLTYTIPSDFAGQLYIWVSVYTPDDKSYSRSQYVNVFASALLINPSKNYYNAGDTITVKVELVSDRISSPTLLWAVNPGSGGDPLAKGSIVGKTGTITFTVPASPDDYYEIDVTATGGGVVVQDSATVSLAKYVTLQITVPDQSYKPGDTVKIHYKFVGIGNATMPTTSTITVMMYTGGGSSRSYDVAALEGDLDFTIPTTAPSTGDVLLYASASGASGQTTTTVYMRPSGGATPASAASGLAAAALGVGVLALLLVLVALFLVMRKPKMPSGGGGSSSSSSTSSFSEMKHVSGDTPKSPPPA